jgi:hypothetical protein
MFFIIAEYITKFGFIFYNPHSEPIGSLFNSRRIR